jgi:hypothetical protein
LPALTRITPRFPFVADQRQNARADSAFNGEQHALYLSLNLRGHDIYTSSGHVDGRDIAITPPVKLISALRIKSYHANAARGRQTSLERRA